MSCDNANRSSLNSGKSDCRKTLHLTVGTLSTMRPITIWTILVAAQSVQMALIPMYNLDFRCTRYSLGSMTASLYLSSWQLLRALQQMTSLSLGLPTDYNRMTRDIKAMGGIVWRVIAPTDGSCGQWGDWVITFSGRMQTSNGIVKLSHQIIIACCVLTDVMHADSIYTCMEASVNVMCRRCSLPYRTLHKIP